MCASVYQQKCRNIHEDLDFYEHNFGWKCWLALVVGSCSRLAAISELVKECPVMTLNVVISLLQQTVIVLSWDSKQVARTKIVFETQMQGLLNTFIAIVDLSRFNISCLKSPASTLVDLTFQSRALRSFSLNQLRNLSL